MKSRLFAATVVLAAVIVPLVPGGVAGAVAQGPSTHGRAMPGLVPTHYRVTPLPLSDLPAVAAQSATGGTIPLWSGTVSYAGTTYPYEMVGKNPFVHQESAGTHIDVPIIPVVVHFPDGTVSDPTVPTGCGNSTVLSPVQLSAESPVFVSHAYHDGTVLVGKGQYVSVFQRANFWSAIQASGNTRYHVSLKPTLYPPVVVSAAQAAPFHPITDPYGSPPCGHQWTVDALALDSYVQTTVIPMLHLSARTFPIILSSNLFGYLISPSVFAALGAHGAFANAQGKIQTYAEVDYDTSGEFPTSPDISVLSHEVGEWMDDPLGTNPTPASYPDVGCSHTLEVGDPLVGTDVTVGPMPNGVTYHPQELAFFSWFYDQVPSQSVNPAWYSSNGTFTTDSAVHPLC